MSEILKDFSVPIVTKAIEENFFGLLAYWGSGSEAQLYKGSDLLWFAAPVPAPSHHAVGRVCLAIDAVDTRIKEIITIFTPDWLPFAWWVSPSDEPANLGIWLLANGFKYAGDIPGMALNLHKLPDKLPLLPDLEIRFVRDVADLEKWVHSKVVGYDTQKVFGEKLLKYELSLGLGENLPIQRYIALLCGEPVASLELFFHAGVAGVYNVVTIPKFRRQGIATALIFEALQIARNLDYQISVLQSTKMGLGVYQRLGFQEYCQLSLYLYLLKSKSGK